MIHKMKKAQMRELRWMSYLLLVSMIILILSSAVIKISKKTYYQEKTFSKNLAFYYDSIMASPHKTEATFKIKGDYLTLNINEDCQVKIKDIGGSEANFYCGLDAYSNTNCKTKSNCLIKDSLVVLKNG